MPLILSKPFASNSAADPADTRQMKRALNRLGYYMPPEDIGITEIPDGRVYGALMLFQKDHGLSPTGRARPSDETVRALDDQITRKKGKYIWRTVGDDRVRPSHAALDGEIRDWSTGLIPGAEDNCRCFAEVFGPPDCREEQAAYEEALQAMEEIEARRSSLIQEIEKLFEKRDDLYRKIVQSLGTTIASNALSAPSGRADIILDILQRYFGNIISNELLAAADRLFTSYAAVVKEIEYKRDQLIVVNVRLRKAREELEQARKALEECLASIQKE